MWFTIHWQGMYNSHINKIMPYASFESVHTFDMHDTTCWGEDVGDLYCKWFYQNLTWLHHKISLNVFIIESLIIPWPWKHNSWKIQKSLWYLLCYRDYHYTTSASQWWIRYHDIRHNWYNPSALLLAMPHSMDTLSSKLKQAL